MTTRSAKTYHRKWARSYGYAPSIEALKVSHSEIFSNRIKVSDNRKTIVDSRYSFFERVVRIPSSYDSESMKKTVLAALNEFINESEGGVVNVTQTGNFVLKGSEQPPTYSVYYGQSFARREGEDSPYQAIVSSVSEAASKVSFNITPQELMQTFDKLRTTRGSGTKIVQLVNRIFIFRSLLD